MGEMFVAPAHEGNDRAEQFTARVGERILVALEVAGVEHPLESSALCCRADV